MAGDWLRLYRKSLDSRVFSDDWLWRLWCWCLLRTSWTRQWKNGRELLPGQFATGRNLASDQLKVSPSKWYRGMHQLQEWGQISLEVNNQFTVVTICNWRTYQGERGEEWTADEQRMNNQRTADEQPVNTPLIREEGEEGKKVRRTAFAAPSIEEVRAYCRERGNSVDPEAFISHYQSNGWKVGKNAMKDWRAAVRTWEKNEARFKNSNGKLDDGKPAESTTERLARMQREKEERIRRTEGDAAPLEEFVRKLHSKRPGEDT